MKCAKPCEIYSRVTGYFRPVNLWNLGKKEEFKDRVPFKAPSEQKKRNNSNDR